MADESKKSDQRSADVQHDQGVRQDEQGVTQIEQGATLVAQGIEQEAQANAVAANTFNILAVTEGVHALAVQVETLNDRVYAKTELDRTRNHLLIVSVVTFVVLSLALGVLLWRIDDSARVDAAQAKKRSAEAIASRRALADCTNPPGTVLDFGYVNPGLCFTRSAQRTQAYIDNAIEQIFTGLRSSEDCLYLRSQGSRPPACVAANARVDALNAGGDPFSPTTTTTSPIQMRPAATVQVSSSPASLPPPVGPVPPTRPASNLLTTLVCVLLVLVGGC